MRAKPTPHSLKRRLAALAVLAALGAPAACTKSEKLESHPDSFVGIGVELRALDQGTEILRVFKGGPSDEAGVLPGDRILRIDGQAVGGWDLATVTAALRGPMNTQVLLQVERDGSAGPITFGVVRRRFSASASSGPAISQGQADGKKVEYVPQ